ncbi:fimbrial outer membrane usher protein [Enterobacter sp. SGAir0187]|uniref:fimbrial outer membrane usher protein n=1 Tax=Enterobacter sp. SGAir0187 TaxID=2836161 RepID=UPI000CEB7100|nr:fimbrial outer membrane usher protein [Enterobacter sp. SGAir0187]
MALFLQLAMQNNAHAEEYRFDSNLLTGTSLEHHLDLDKFSQKEVAQAEGQQLVDISLNGEILEIEVPVRFKKKSSDDTSASPCIDRHLLNILQLKPDANANESLDECVFLSQIVKRANWHYDASNLVLEFVVPQVSLLRKPRGFIPVSEWNAGNSVLFARHSTNYFHNENSTSGSTYNYLWSIMNIGANAGVWQARHQANLRYMDSNKSGSSYKWNSVRTWVQRPLPDISSQLSLGDNYTSTNMFGGISYNGIKLETDERMWPQGKRGYAPEVIGTATSNARVIIKQQDRVIYETRVPPGPFVISDLYNTKSNGDLHVDVISADGKTTSFTVPYAAVPDSVRPGNFSYELAAGRVRNYYSVNNEFTEGVLKYGLNNYFTLNSGMRVAKDYEALLAGGVWSSAAGALALNTTWSHAKEANDKSSSGWRAELSYSKTFATRTNLVLAAYRYSTSGYRDLQDVLGMRREDKEGEIWYSDTLQQRNRLAATMSQNMYDFGTLGFSASTTDYYGNRPRVSELQLTYSNNWKKLSYNISAGRQRTSWDNSSIYSVNDSDYHSDNYKKTTENTISLNISIPLDWRDTSSRVSLDMTQDKYSRSTTTTLSGSAGDDNRYSYSIYGGYDQYRQSEGGHETSWGANLQDRTSIGTLSASWSQGQGFKQLGLGTNGTLAIHEKGVTYGPYASDTFALVHAQGAKGALVRNGQGSRIDTFGNAILPSLVPYRKNQVSLDTRTMNQNVEIKSGSARLVPYAGSVTRVDFETLYGRPVLIIAKTSDGTLVPMGADVLDVEGKNIGMVGQAGMVYARLPEQSGVIQVKWGDASNKQCRIRYQLDTFNSEDAEPIQFDAICKESQS